MRCCLVAGYIYFVNHLKEVSYIEVMDKKGGNRRIIYKSKTERPYHLRVDPQER